MHLGCDLFKAGWIEKAFTYGGLVGNDDNGRAQRCQLLQCRSDPWQKYELRPVQNVVPAPPAIYYPVSIDEYGRAIRDPTWIGKKNSQQV